MELPNPALRKVPESRIKLLTSYQVYEFRAYVSNEEAFIREHMIKEIGLEIARKLFKFNKVLITRDDNKMIYQSSIEVIVPPCPPSPNTNPPNTSNGDKPNDNG